MRKNNEAADRPVQTGYKRYSDNKLTIGMKILFSLVYAWSCFFWGGVTVINFYWFMPQEAHLASGFLIGDIFITLGLIACWLRCYILQFPLNVIGGSIYLVNAGEMIDNSAKTVSTPAFELRYMPVAIILILSLCLLVLQLISFFAKRSQAKEEYNNRPSGSILD